MGGVGDALRTGATPVSPDADGNRQINDWQFRYEGWSQLPDEPICRAGATRTGMFPESRKGSLDKDVLSRLGMTADRMSNEQGLTDALFFYQLLPPICDTKKQSEVTNDPRKSFYYDVSKYSNLYALSELELGNGYGHHWVNTNPTELLQWDGVTVMDSVRGGSNGGILRRFDKRDGNTAYDQYIDQAFTKTRWLELKRVVKLCNNNTAPKRGEANYNPAYKYDLIYDVLVTNVNAITGKAALDLAGDETTYAHEGYGEPLTSLVSRIMGKPGVTRGGQIVLVSDIDWIRPRAYLHRHKCHDNEWSLQGPSEVKHILDQLDNHIVNEVNSAMGTAIFAQKPHITWDNFFSGEAIAEYAAANGYGMTTTLRCDRFPKGIPKKHFHFAKTLPGASRPRAAKFLTPIVATKRVGDSMLQLTSFQSTSSCNFLSVNAYSRCGLYAVTKERGRNKNGSKRQWAIKMNDAKKLYLKTYGVIDRLDHLIKNCHMHYRYDVLAWTIVEDVIKQILISYSVVICY